MADDSEIGTRIRGGTGQSSQAGAQAGYHLDLIDFIGAALTLPLLLFVMMFIVTGTEGLLEQRRFRRRLYVVLLLIEVAAGYFALKVLL